MSIALSPRSAALGSLALVLCGTAVIRDVPLIDAWNQTQESAARRAASQLAERTRARTHRAALQALIGKQSEIIASGAGWLFGEVDSTLSDAALSRRLQRAAEDASIQLVSVQPIPRDSGMTDGRAFTARARAVAAGDFRSVITFLVMIEDAPQRLAVRELTVTQQDAGAAATGQPETMRVEVVVEGLALLYELPGRVR